MNTKIVTGIAENRNLILDSDALMIEEIDTNKLFMQKNCTFCSIHSCPDRAKIRDYIETARTKQLLSDINEPCLFRVEMIDFWEITDLIPIVI